MKISGSGKIEAGKLDEDLVVSGSAHIRGDLECNRIKSSGSLKGEGNLIIHGDVKSSGSFRITGCLQGDNNAHFSGSAKIGQGIILQGQLKSSGSLRVKNSVSALLGIKIYGSARIAGNLYSQKDVCIDGLTKISGYIEAENVKMGDENKKIIFHIFKKKKYPYMVYGTIRAKNKIDLCRTMVMGDVIGREIIINKNSYIEGKVYYVDSIEIHPKAILKNNPIQIAENEL